MQEEHKPRLHSVCIKDEGTPIPNKPCYEHSVLAKDANKQEDVNSMQMYVASSVPVLEGLGMLGHPLSLHTFHSAHTKVAHHPANCWLMPLPHACRRV